MSSQPKRSLFDTVITDGKRLQFIASVLSKHGLGTVARLFRSSSELGHFSPENDSLSDLNTRDIPDLPQRFRLVLEELGPTFIKFGQILSTRPDLISPIYIKELEKLQDNAPEVPFEQIREICNDSFGSSIDDIFEFFSPEPLATASIAQVHKARLKGRDVVVKVQRPNIEREIISDLTILRYIAKFAEATIEEASLFSPVGIVREFESAIIQELNFLLEAEHTVRAREMSADDPHIIVPEIIGEYTNSRVITQEFIDGEKLNTLEVGSPRAKKLASFAMEAAFKQIFEYGFFHGDPHPGNILITRDDRVAFLDWGLVGHLSSVQRSLLVDLIVSFVLDDMDSTARILLRMGWPEKRVNLRRFRQDVAHIRDTYLRHDLSRADLSAILSESMEIAHAHSIVVNPEYALLAKSLGTVDGILRAVYPSLDLLETLRPFSKRLLQERYSPEALTQAGIAGLLNVNHLLKELPIQFDQLMTDIEDGRFQVRVHNPGLDHYSQSQTILGSRLLLGMVGSTMFFSAIYLFAEWRPLLYGVDLLPFVALLLLLSASVILWGAVGWHFFVGGIKRLRIKPWVGFFNRK